MNYPFVSVCTPTFNRRPFIPFAIKTFFNFIWPKDRIEWIIIDDGTDPIRDLVENIPEVKYFYYKDKMLLGKKRNLMHTKCKGDIIIYMDDDDYYPPNRIKHAVDTLFNNPSYLIAGSSAMHIYYECNNTIYQCGPYKENHATAATFAFKKELLKTTKFNENDVMSEEKTFLKNYTIPLLQLDPFNTILVFSHKHNSLNKEKLLENPAQYRMQATKYKVEDFIQNNELLQFYKIDMNNLLVNYEPGNPNNKPEIMEEITKYEKKMKNKKKEFETKQLLTSMFNSNDVVQYKKQIEEKNLLINELFKKIKLLTEENSELKNKLLEKA